MTTATKKAEAVSVPVSAAESIQRVMAKVDAVGKTGENKHQHYRFRGIDAVVNAVGPALREVGGFIKPDVLKVKRERGVSNSGTPTIDVFVRVRYSWFGSDGGDPVTAVVEGEATDTSDKSTTKAMSVAFRTFLVQVLCLPTGEPDPDEDHIERQGARQPANPKQERIKGPSVAKGKWAGRILDANDTTELRGVWDEAFAAGEVGLRFAAAERKYIDKTAEVHGLSTPPKDVTVTQLINAVRKAMEDAAAAAPAAEPEPEGRVEDWPTAEIPNGGEEA